MRFWFFYLILCVCCVAKTLAANILVIESYHAEYLWDASYTQGLYERLGDLHTIERFQMDTKRIPRSEFQKKADEAFQKFTQMKPDLVVLGDDNALRYLGKRIDETGTPVVYLGINGNPRQIANFENTTGVLERPLFLRSIVTLKPLLGQQPRVLVLFDSGPTSEASVAEAFANKDQLQVSGVTLNLKMIGLDEEWKNTILSSKELGYTAIFIGLYHTLVDSEGNSVDADDILFWTSRHTPVPNFAFWDFSVGRDKTIGGYVLFGKTQAELASDIIEKILAGTPASSIMPIFGERGRFLFSKSQLQRWKLTLPAYVAAHAEWVD
jgi:hypothetical protein